MKKIITILLIGVLVIACDKNEKKTDGYVIKGTAKGVYNGMRAYLKTTDEKGVPVTKDTAIVMNGEFSFDGKIDHPQMWLLSMSNVPGVVPIMMENETITVNFDKNKIENSEVTGTKSNDALSGYTKGFQALSDKRNDLNKEFSTSASSTDPALKAKISADYASLNEKINNYPYEFLEKNNKDNYFSLSLIENILKSKPTDLTPMEKAFDNMEDEIKNSHYGEIVKNQLAQLKMQNERLSMLDIGKMAPNFSAPDPDGKQLSLNEIKGKATIIDFWASWCGPCRRENPNVVKVYEKYKDKGLEIISVSLDRPGQKNRWLKAIEDDKLTWHHVSNLQYFNDPVAQQYNIQSIPATFILDADGKIVAKSLRGQALEDQIAQMLN